MATNVKVVADPTAQCSTGAHRHIVGWVAHAFKCTFDGQRTVIFSGGAAEADDALLEQVRGIQASGGFRLIVGHNGFTRKKEDALKLLGQIMEVYDGK